jgi:pilus assembly protein Flp/PilA
MGQAERTFGIRDAAGRQASGRAAKGFFMTFMTGKLSAQPCRLSDRIADFCDDESGSTAIEYSLIVGMIFLVIVAAVTNMANSTSVMYDDISTNLAN